ncbi:MAG TPA: class I SAM-dependent methyltransferase [Saprospiraceae bacterium]|nr:class I SAM-dependent methyltransferase [Saprospiraceae bacterium]
MIRNLILIQLLIVLFSLFMVGCQSSKQEDKDLGWYLSSAKGRDVWQKPELVIQKMGALSDRTIVDIGAGTGYFTFRLAFHAQKVIATDIDPKMVELMELFAAQLPVHIHEKIDIRQVEPDHPGTQEGEANIYLIINTITYIKHPVDYLTHIHQLLPEEGMVMIVDFKTLFLEVDAPPIHERIAHEIIVQWLGEAGFSKIEYDLDLLANQYVVMGWKKE